MSVIFMAGLVPTRCGDCNRGTAATGKAPVNIPVAVRNFRRLIDPSASQLGKPEPERRTESAERAAHSFPLSFPGLPKKL